jgi:hypothetical protein
MISLWLQRLAFATFATAAQVSGSIRTVRPGLLVPCLGLRPAPVRGPPLGVVSVVELSAGTARPHDGH